MRRHQSTAARPPLAVTSLAGLLLVGVVLTAAPAAAAEPPSPTTGPTTGGTLVSGAVPQAPDVAFVDVAGGSAHSLALDQAGRAYAWGAGSSGRLGDGRSTNSPSPVAVTMPAGVDSFAAVAAGDTHSVALTDDGRAFAWGSGYGGALGDGTSRERTTPVAVMMPPGVRFVDIAAGASFTLAAGDDGRAYAWGSDGARGLLGVGGLQSSDVPVRVNLPTDVRIVDVSAASYLRSYALDSDGRAYVWGSYLRQVPGSRFYGPTADPVQLLFPPGVDGFTSISGGIDSAVALDRAGRPWRWLVGTGSSAPVLTPEPLSAPSDAAPLTQSSSGELHHLAVGADGRPYAWGTQGQGQLGNGTPGRSAAVDPTAVAWPEDAGSVVRLAAGGNHSLAIDERGRAWAWGLNYSGQLGHTSSPSATSSAVPVAVDMPTSPAPVTVTSVRVAGRPTTDLTQTADTWTATTTASPTCRTPGDVTVSYTVGDDPQTLTHTTPAAFTYTAASPTITTQPTGTTLTTGTTFTTTVAATVEPTATVQWQSAAGGTDAWTDLPGATTTTLTTTPTTTTSYRAVLTNCAGTITSNPATATVTAPPTPPTPPGTPTETTACTPGAPIPTGYRLLSGTPRNDTLRGTDGPDLIRAGDGNDTIAGLGGDDIVCGGNGIDVITTATGHDTAFGQSGADLITTGPGDDTIHGGAGPDVLDGSTGTDTAYPGPGVKLLLNIEHRR